MLKIKFSQVLCLTIILTISSFCYAEEEIKIPMSIKYLFGTKTIYLSATLYKPDGKGPFPLAIINHGSPRSVAERNKTISFEAQSREFVKRGFVVVVPMRRGYGKSEGDYAESYGNCEDPDYYSAGMEGTKDIKAVIEFMVKQPYINKTKILVAGHSAGGFASLAIGSLNIEGVIGIINFAGGRGSIKEVFVCSPNVLMLTVAEFGKTSRVPTLWIYTENDKFFSPLISKEMHEYYVKKGGNAKLVILPPFKKDGHTLFTNKDRISIWTPVVDDFLHSLGFPIKKGKQ